MRNISWLQAADRYFAGVVLIALVGLSAFFVYRALQAERGMVQDVGAVATTQPPGTPTPTEAIMAKLEPVSDRDHIRGEASADIVLYEYADFACPFCSRFHQTLNQIVAESNGRVAWVYRTYPWHFHPLAQEAAEGAECVGKHGNEAFWLYADSLYAQNNQAGKLEQSMLDQAAEAAGVNLQEFSTCLATQEMAPTVKARMASGTEAGITGTPQTILLTKDGQYRYIPGALPLEEMREIIENYL